MVTVPWYVRNYLSTGKWFFSSIGAYNLVFYNLAFAKAKATRSKVEAVRFAYMREAIAKSGLESIVYREIPLYWPILLKNQLAGAVIFWMAADRFQWGYFLTGRYVQSGAHDRLWDTGLAAAIRRILRSPGGSVAVFQVFFNILVAILGFVGMLSALRRPGSKVVAALCLSICVYYALTAGPVGFGRYRLPAEPFLATFAAGVLRKWFEKRLEKTKSG